MGKTKVKNINESISNFVKGFLETNNVDSEVVELWVSDETQKSFDKTIKDYKKKEDKKEEKKEEKKKNKTKGMPKKASSSYICFCKIKRTEVKSKFPDLNTQQIMSKLGDVWSELSDTEKKKWEKESEKDKVRYEKELAKFYEDHPEEVKKPKIKPALSSYVLFCNANRKDVKAKNPTLSPTDIMKTLGKLWKDLDDKTEWAELATKDKERYNGEVSDQSEGEAEKKDDKPEKKCKQTKKKKEPEVVFETVEEVEEIVEEVEEKPKKKKTVAKKEKAKK